MNTNPNQCNSCGEPLYWLAHERTGKPAPIEVKQNSERGNIAVDLTARTYRIVPKEERAQQSEWLHLNHFVECPQSNIWSKAGRGA